MLVRRLGLPVGHLGTRVRTLEVRVRTLDLRVRETETGARSLTLPIVSPGSNGIERECANGGLP